MIKQRTISSANNRAKERNIPRRLLTGVILSVLVLTYVGLTNSVTTQGYQLNSLQKEFSVLEKSNAELKLSLAAAQSLHYLGSEASALALVPVNNIEYIGHTSAVAVR